MKAEQHPKFIYRCFILQALSEFLSWYNRAKIEFIGFSRKAAPREAITPSKPRSAVRNYLLNDIIPLGTLIHTEEIAHKKRATTSQWAILAIVSSPAKTGESSLHVLYLTKISYCRKQFKSYDTSSPPFLSNSTKNRQRMAKIFIKSVLHILSILCFCSLLQNSGLRIIIIWLTIGSSPGCVPTDSSAGTLTMIASDLGLSRRRYRCRVSFPSLFYATSADLTYFLGFC